ncbi:hypothetical protein D0Z07_5535 [Hyphodiscus hymeniophilus]|uniref:mannan endo-1,4-beta-mannosidase n=1 Tax=Hyphodiscus hymeniophilus TaxID=353542 RepID=A0A9P6VHI6_9HELO|nr:hypothetical protein D0Z07_5535 [Hyphodiscus hymeniophilus]
MKLSSTLTVSVALAVASAQQTIWGQCGGQGWTGPTTCIAGAYCFYSNPWYSQCLAGAATTSTAATSASKASTLSTVKTPTASSIKATTSSIKPSTTTSSKPSTTSSAPSTGTSGITSFAKTNGLLFNINGKETYFMGTNTYWIGFLTNNADVDLVMTHLAATGLKVLRVWGFNDVTSIPGSGTVWFQSFISGSSPTINTGANGLERLDYVVQSAEAHGISLIINFVNNWTDYGGMQAYCTYYDITITDWYTSVVAQAQYQIYIAAVVSRYKTSTAIFAWELANEPRCSGCDVSVINTWATTTSAYIKSLDANHMVTMGDEGFGLSTLSDGSYPFQLSAGGYNWTQNLMIPDIDFGTYHLYPSSWGVADSWGPLWIQAHAEAAAAIGKPVIMEEYGSLTLTDEAPWQAEVLDTETAGDMYWQYGDDLSTGETANDGYAIYYGSATYTTLVADHAAAMNAKTV